MSLAALNDALKPILEVLRTAPLDAAALEKALPLSSPQMQALKKLMREGVTARWLCDRENGAVRYSRVLKSDAGGGMSVDAVHMSGPGAGHTHPNGEIDLCFTVSGAPKFNGEPEGWTVYLPGSWHVPTVEGGVMDILYFLPGGAIRFEPKPETR
jgi:hypothetical protein